MKTPITKRLRLKILALGVGLIATLVITTPTRSQSTEKPEAIAFFEAGIAAYQANDLPLAYREFLTAAKAGHADSQFNVALMFEKGIGVGKDEKEAFVWYGKSASQGNSAVQFNLGVLYENGRGTKVDFAKANKWYRKAAVQGDALAIGNLGMLYVRGQGVKEDKVTGVALLMVSATRDPSPENHARRNLTATRGLSSEMIGAAQTLAGKFSKARNLLAPLDEHLKQSAKDAEKKQPSRSDRQPSLDDQKNTDGHGGH